MITEWEELEGKTIVEVVPYYRDYILVFGDGDYAHVSGSGEEVHGAHWPVLTDEDENFVTELIDGT